MSPKDLSVHVNEAIKVTDSAGSPSKPVTGLIAILDALGAKQFSETESYQFLESRDLVLNKLSERAEAGQIDKKRLKMFTFNDTVVIVFLAKHHEVTLRDVTQFSQRLRAFLMHSLQNRILFRGALSVGEFYRVDNHTNTVMGPAVSDAAAWFEQSDWMGVHATPHTSMFIQSLLQRASAVQEHDNLLIDYKVPLKGRSPLTLKVINWPKAFYVKGLRPDGGQARAMLLSFLSRYQTPVGTEMKYFNTVSFFDHVEAAQELEKRFGHG